MALRGFSREETFLFAPTLNEMIPADHPVRYVAVFVDGLTRADWMQLGAACRDRLPYLWLTGWQRPDHTTLWRFYRQHRAGMRGLLKRTVRTVVETGLVDLAVQAVDGTRVAGSAARERSLDAAGLAALLAKTDAAIADLKAQNAGGGDPPPPRLPQALAKLAALRERVRAAQARVAAAEHQERANVTDPDATLQKRRGGGFQVGYNPQAVVAGVAAPEPGGPGGRSITISRDDARLRAHRALMATDAARDAYRRRKTLPEPAFGILKEQQAARRFLLRGLANVRAEWALLATAFNLRTLARLWQATARPPAAPAAA